MTISETSRRICDRWIVRGTIEACSALMMRTGAAEKIRDATSDDSEQWLHEIDLDHAGEPFLGASGLKGIIRSLLAARCTAEDAAVMDRLFGYAARETSRSGEKVSGAGRAEFRNAISSGGESRSRTRTRSMVRIDRGTGAAADGLLRTQKIAEAGMRFAVEIVLDGVGEADAAFIVAAMRLLDGSADAALGGGTRQGFGRVLWLAEDERIHHLDAAAIVAWLDGAPGADWRNVTPLSGRRHLAFQRAVADIRWSAPQGRRIVLPTRLAFDGFFLVSQAAEVDARSGQKINEGDADRRPLVAGHDGPMARPLLTGTAFKGPLRAQAERIWRTLADDRSDEVPEVIEELFGSETRAGALRCSDFVGELMRKRRHELVAIDRFTGGAADGQKFSHDVFESPVLQGEMTLDLERGFAANLTGKTLLNAPKPLSAAALGLMVLVLRDLGEGDVYFGFGSRKGYGRFGSASVGDAAPLRALADALVENGVDVASAVAALRGAARPGAGAPDRHREEV